MSTNRPPTANRRRWLRHLSVPFIILALSLVAIAPLFGPSLTCTDDAAFHLLRLTQLDHLLRQGIFYSRWAPDMAQGYGFPFFNFYAPLAYYLAELVSLLVQNLNLGMRLTLALGMVLSGLTAYRLSRDHFSQLAALGTAVAYIYAPYYAFDVYFRGNLAESMAWPLLPLALWGMGHLARTRQPRWLLLTSLSYTAILLTHNVFALIFSPLLALYGVWETGDWRLETRKSISNLQSLISNLFPVLLALLLSLGLSAFFWLPALAERSLVHSDRLLVPPLFVYWGNFLLPGEIFAPPQTVHPDLINPSPARALGLVPLLLALPALLAGWWRFRDNRRRQLLFFTGATAVYIFLMTAVSEPVWANLPLIEYVQFPWRLLGPAALTLAMLIGASIDALLPDQQPAAKKDQKGVYTNRENTENKEKSVFSPSVFIRGAVRFTPPTKSHSRLVISACFISALVLADLAWLDVRYCPGLDAPTVAAMQAFERDSFTIGTTAKGEYLPLTVTYLPEEPAVTPFLPLPETARTAPDELVPSTVEVTAVLQSITQEPLRYRAEISAAAPFTLTANVFAYAGWQAAVDGQPVPITPSVGTGLITVLVPVGEHTIDIWFGSTPLRTTASLVSLTSLILLVVLPFAKRRSHVRWSTPQVWMIENRSHFAFLILFALFLFAAVTFALPRMQTPLRRSGLAALGETAVFHNNMALLNYQIASRTLPADGALLVSATWQARQPLNDSFRDTVRLVGPDGNLWSEKTAAAPRAFRGPRSTPTWSPDEYAESQHLLEPLPGTPPGTYHIELILFDTETLATIPLADGRLSLDLGTVQITRPDTPIRPSAQYGADVNWGDLSLTGYSLDRAEAAPGDPFLLTLFWRVNADPTADMTVRLELAAPDGSAAFQFDLPPVRDDFPTTQWQAGDFWRGQHGFRLPVDLASGVYRWQLTLCDELCRDLTADLGTLTIHAPERLFTPPPLAFVPDDGAFTGLATLLGANMMVEDARLHVTLAWRAEQETAASATDAASALSAGVSYRVFVHLVDEAGQILAQSDGEPAAWTRPTTGWLTGEIVLDEHELDLTNVPARSYRLNVGLYDPQSGERVPLAGGATAVTIPNVTVP